MTRRLLFVILATASPLLVAFAQVQQGGDQFLDGIGETSLVARYALGANAEDASRNQFHGTLQGAGAEFVDDTQFRRVLLLTGAGGYVQLPGRTLDNEDTISVAGWVFLPTGASGPVFDFGQSMSAHFSALASRTGIRASVVTGGTMRGEASSSVVPENQWISFAVVLDPAAKALTLYLNGVRVSRDTNVPVSMTDIVNKATASSNRFFLGRSQEDGAPTLHARLRDVRVYRIALADQQAMTIHTNAIAAGQTAAARGARGPAPISTADIPKDSPLAIRLRSVPDITVETVVGTLPHLPYMVPAVYRDNSRGPDVRVIWPAPKDTVSVAKPGTYTVSGSVPGTTFAPKATVIVKAMARPGTLPSRTIEAFPLGQVVLDKDANGRETPFMLNRDKFIRGLADSNPDNFLYNFRDAFGQPQPPGTVQLEGWDNQTTRLRGHASGHYLSAIAQAYASTVYDPALRAKFLQKMNYLIDTLYDLSQKSGRPATPGGASVADPRAVPIGPGRDGYDSNLRAGAIRTDYWNWGVGFISAYPPDQFIMLEQGATYGTRDTQIWAPYYTLHKILAGLLDSYEVAGNKKALEIAKGMGTWAYTRLKALPPETLTGMWGRYIAGEYGGMNEVMARLYRLTGDKSYLDCAKLFDNTNFFFGNASHEGGLAKNVDTVRGKHANQHIPQITGALETFRDTNEAPYYDIATNFWEIVNGSYMYSIGGVAGAKTPNNAECFPAEPDSLWENGFASGGQNETCATYNLLKLDRQLFMFDPAAKYMDHYERALYNHILASVAEDDAGNTYHVPLTPGAQKRFGNAEMNGFTCCNGTALESNTKLQDSIYFKSADSQTLFVNLFVASTLTWADRGITVQQITSFPYADTSKIVIKNAGQFELKIRVPHWATRGFFVKINGRDQAIKAEPGTYVSVGKTWRANDTVEIRTPFMFYLETVMDQPNVASLFYGPVLLAAEESGPRTDWREVVLNATDISKSITGDPATLRFAIAGAAFKPFFETYGRNSVYVHVTLK